MDSATVSTDEMVIDETSQAATEHNKKVWDRTLAEAGFEAVVSRAISQFTIVMHTRTLTHEERRQFLTWADDQAAVQQVGEDPDGTIWRVRI